MNWLAVPLPCLQWLSIMSTLSIVIAAIVSLRSCLSIACRMLHNWSVLLGVTLTGVDIAPYATFVALVVIVALGNVALGNVALRLLRLYVARQLALQYLLRPITSFPQFIQSITLSPLYYWAQQLHCQPACVTVDRHTQAVFAAVRLLCGASGLAVVPG